MYTTKEGKAGRNKIKFPYWFLVELFFDYVNTSSACVFSAILKQGAKHRRSMNHVRTPAMILNWLFSHLSRVFFADASQTSQLNMLQFSAMHKIYTWNQSILVGRFKACLFSANLSFQWGACVVHISWFYLMMWNLFFIIFKLFNMMLRKLRKSEHWAGIGQSFDWLYFQVEVARQ